MRIAEYERKQIYLEQELSRYPNLKVAIEEIRKKSQKKAFSCPFCGEFLVLRAGAKYDPHFAHLRGTSCALAMPTNNMNAKSNGRILSIPLSGM